MFTRICRVVSVRIQRQMPASVNQSLRNFVLNEGRKHLVLYQSFYLPNYLQITHNSSNAPPQVPVVQYDEIKNLVKSREKYLIDVREPDELKEKGKIATSINIPLGSVGNELCLAEDLFEKKYGIPKPNENSELIFYCQIGRRSLKAAELAWGLGFKNVKNYEGSWLDWAKHEGLPK